MNIISNKNPNQMSNCNYFYYIKRKYPPKNVSRQVME